jgi:hypothetical protein
MLYSSAVRLRDDILVIPRSGVARISRSGHHGEREARAYMGVWGPPVGSRGKANIFSSNLHHCKYGVRTKYRVGTCPLCPPWLRH